MFLQTKCLKTPCFQVLLLTFISPFDTLSAVSFMKTERIYKEGVVEEKFPNTLFKVKLDDGKEILAHIGGKLRVNYIRILLGDRVQVEMTPYDETKGRIVRRLK